MKPITAKKQIAQKFFVRTLYLATIISDVVYKQ